MSLRIGKMGQMGQRLARTRPSVGGTLGNRSVQRQGNGLGARIQPQKQQVRHCHRSKTHQHVEALKEKGVNLQEKFQETGLAPKMQTFSKVISRGIRADAAATDLNLVPVFTNVPKVLRPQRALATMLAQQNKPKAEFWERFRGVGPEFSNTSQFETMSNVAKVFENPPPDKHYDHYDIRPFVMSANYSILSAWKKGEHKLYYELNNWSSNKDPNVVKQLARNEIAKDLRSVCHSDGTRVYTEEQVRERVARFELCIDDLMKCKLGDGYMLAFKKEAARRDLYDAGDFGNHTGQCPVEVSENLLLNPYALQGSAQARVVLHNDPRGGPLVPPNPDTPIRDRDMLVVPLNEPDKVDAFCAAAGTNLVHPRDVALFEREMGFSISQQLSTEEVEELMKTKSIQLRVDAIVKEIDEEIASEKRIRNASLQSIIDASKPVSSPQVVSTQASPLPALQLQTSTQTADTTEPAKEIGRLAPNPSIDDMSVEKRELHSGIRSHKL